MWGAGTIISALPYFDFIPIEVRLTIAGIGAIAWRLMTKTELKLK